MARYQFREGKTYVGRLQTVRERPIENNVASGVRLLRLEFEIFEMLKPQQMLTSLGKIACRDIVAGPAVDATRDVSLAAYAGALRLQDASRVPLWLGLASGTIWVTIKFGHVGSRDLRNTFQAIFPFDADGWSVQEYDYGLNKEWVTVSEAADDLGCSASKVRRVVNVLELEWGTQLVRRTSGNQRRIRLSLLRNLWPA